MKFEKGLPRPSSSGRKKGTPNRVTKALKDAILRAADMAGETLVREGRTRGQGLEAYLHFLAINEPAVLGAMLRALIPHEIKAAGDDLPLLDVRVYTREGQPATRRVAAPPGLRAVAPDS